jgi:hypothetical protein
MASRSQDATSTHADAAAKGFVTHRGVLSLKVIAGLRAQIHQAANRVLWDDRALVLHWTDDAHVGEFPLHPRVDGARREAEKRIPFPAVSSAIDRVTSTAGLAGW